MLIVVVVLGVLLVAGLAVVVGTIIKRVSAPESDMPSGFGTITPWLPPETRFLDMTTAEGRLVLRLEDEEGTLLLLLNLRDGSEEGRIRLP